MPPTPTCSPISKRDRRRVGIVSSTVNMTPHVGHKIEITGTAVPPAEAMKEKKDVPKAPHYMKVTAMKHALTDLPMKSQSFPIFGVVGRIRSTAAQNVVFIRLVPDGPAIGTGRFFLFLISPRFASVRMDMDARNPDENRSHLHV